MVTDGLKGLPLSLTVPGALMVYVLLLSGIHFSLDLWMRWWAGETAMAVFCDLRSEGISLRNRPVAGEPNYAAWKTELDGWLSRVYSTAEKINKTLRTYLERLDRVGPPPGGIPVVSAEHARWIGIASEVLVRMQRYIEKDIGIDR
jgi:hypothetical protein